VAVGYEYMLERQENGWWLVRFPKIPEALTEGEIRGEASANAMDCLITALEGYMKAGRPKPRPSAPSAGRDRAVLPSLVTAKLAVYETMRNRGGPRSGWLRSSASQKIRCTGSWTYAIARKWESSTRH
jgi:antitoxin HicB